MSGRSWTPSFGKLISARDREPDEQHDDGDGIADRPGNEVHEPAATFDVDEIAVLQEPGALLDDHFAGLDAVDHLDRGVVHGARLDAATFDSCCRGLSTNT